MTASSAADIPRPVEFVFSRSRLDVAISRARSVDEIQLISTLCSFAEKAT